jgi:hypothetical protein
MALAVAAAFWAAEQLTAPAVVTRACAAPRTDLDADVCNELGAKIVTPRP